MTLRRSHPLFVTLAFVSALLLSAMNTRLAEASDGHDEHGDEHGNHMESEKGPHGGKLLSSEHTVVELLFIEQQDASAFRAWVTRNDTPVNDKNTQLNVELTRLNGQVNALNFTPINGVWLSTETVNAPHSFDISVTLNTAGEHYQWNFDSYEGRVEIPSDIAAKAGIKSELASSGDINKTITVYGKIVADPSGVSHIRARFPGTIIKIQGNIGDKLTKGDIVAQVESNESLKRYSLTSPLSGIITNRNGNPGEQAQQQALLTVANYDKTWVEFKVFPSQAQHVSVGQPVTISSDYLKTESVISNLLPSDTAQPFLRARVALDNSSGQWAPGLLLAGRVIIKQTPVPLVVYNQALQSVNEQDVVFIQAGTRYEARPLTLGVTDGAVTQVLEGLNAGDQYVVENSYLIKADLEKSGASHQH